jgi:hypothetical protein
MKYLLIPLLLILFASCDPCKRLAKDKYKPCFAAMSDTITLHDTLSIHDTIIVPQMSVEWLIKNDTIIETERIFYSKRGDTTVIICKGDTIYYSKDVIREVKVPYTKYIYKEAFEWKWLAGFGFLAAIIILIYRRKA